MRSRSRGLTKIWSSFRKTLTNKAFDVGDFSKSSFLCGLITPIGLDGYTINLVTPYAKMESSHLLLEFLPLNEVAMSGKVSLVTASAGISEIHHLVQLPLKVGIPEFLNGIGKGVEAHAAKLESEIGDLQKLLVTRTLKLKKIGIPCQHRKLILNHAHKYRLGLWRPRADLVKAK
ncbi:hypothetical protein GH714_026378 [Hevea brasiliensis]|uniref:Small ribosomal subunit protein mS41 SAM domain-containing protein n=1 Tax=Hevea brasiliensis TaxID=3981 RepID=A0A6A6M3D9_HEVBR|nr:hypothetical protein GH714_026378 [Hevea brasiliensis]